ncbi:MAG: SHOCT domain-containing protein [Treponema sp.]|nr:SHOCT domain-containing protein [Treponema sp.]
MYHGMYGFGQAFGGNGYFGFPWFHFVFGFLFLALVVFGVVYSIRSIRSGKTGLSNGSDPHARALDIVVERFARGEIDAETFRAMKAELDKK